jgi:hypothetical protein
MTGSHATLIRCVTAHSGLVHMSTSPSQNKMKCECIYSWGWDAFSLLQAASHLFACCWVSTSSETRLSCKLLRQPADAVQSPKLSSLIRSLFCHARPIGFGFHSKHSKYSQVRTKVTCSMRCPQPLTWPSSLASSGDMSL